MSGGDYWAIISSLLIIGFFRYVAEKIQEKKNSRNDGGENLKITG
jgi:hypothetical protein